MRPLQHVSVTSYSRSFKLRHRRFVCNNEVKDNIGQNTTSFSTWV